LFFYPGAIDTAWCSKSCQKNSPYLLFSVYCWFSSFNGTTKSQTIASTICAVICTPKHGWFHTLTYTPRVRNKKKLLSFLPSDFPPPLIIPLHFLSPSPSIFYNFPFSPATTPPSPPSSFNPSPSASILIYSTSRGHILVAKVSGWKPLTFTSQSQHGSFKNPMKQCRLWLVSSLQVKRWLQTFVMGSWNYFLSQRPKTLCESAF